MLQQTLATVRLNRASLRQQYAKNGTTPVVINSQIIIPERGLYQHGMEILRRAMVFQTEYHDWEAFRGSLKVRLHDGELAAKAV